MLFKLFLTRRNKLLFLRLQGDRRRVVRPHRTERFVHRKGRRPFDPSGVGSRRLHARTGCRAQRSQGKPCPLTIIKPKSDSADLGDKRERERERKQRLVHSSLYSHLCKIKC